MFVIQTGTVENNTISGFGAIVISKQTRKIKSSGCVYMAKQKKFMKIYEALKEDILNGIFNTANKIPSEHDLVQLYQSSRETVRKALDLLALEWHDSKDSW